jgi:hypothetical protein
MPGFSHFKPRGLLHFDPVEYPVTDVFGIVAWGPGRPGAWGGACGNSGAGSSSLSAVSILAEGNATQLGRRLIRGCRHDETRIRQIGLGPAEVLNTAMPVSGRGHPVQQGLRQCTLPEGNL